MLPSRRSHPLRARRLSVLLVSSSAGDCRAEGELRITTRRTPSAMKRHSARSLRNGLLDAAHAGGRHADDGIITIRRWIFVGKIAIDGGHDLGFAEQNGLSADAL